MRFTRAGLAVRQDCRVVAVKAAQDKVAGALVEDGLLGAAGPEDLVEVKGAP